MKLLATLVLAVLATVSMGSPDAHVTVSHASAPAHAVDAHAAPAHAADAHAVDAHAPAAGHEEAAEPHLEHSAEEPHNPSVSDVQTQAEEEGRSLWKSDEGAVRDKDKEYANVHEDTYVLDTDPQSESKVAHGAHLVNSEELKLNLAARACATNPELKTWLLRLNLEQQKLFKHAAYAAADHYLTNLGRTEFSAKGMELLTSNVAAHIIQHVGPLYNTFNHENVYADYQRSLHATLAGDAAHGEAAHTGSEEHEDPLYGIDGVTDPQAQTAARATATLTDPVGAKATFGAEFLEDHARIAAKVAGPGTQIFGNPADSDPVFDAAPVARPERKGLGPLHRTLGLTEDPVGPAALASTKAVAKGKAYAKAASKSAYFSRRAALLAAHLAALRASAVYPHPALYPGLYNPLASPFVHPLAQPFVHPLAAAYGGYPYGGYPAPLPLSPWHVLAAKQAAAHAKLAASAYKSAAKEYARTVKYWAKQQRAVKRLRKSFIKAYNKFVGKVRRRHGGSEAYKAALIHLTSAISSALAVPTRSSKF